MGDSRSKCYDDEEDWYSLKHEAGIGNVPWGVYSTEADFAEKGFRAKNLTSTKLLEYVDKEMKKRDLKIKKDEEREERKLYQKLKKKYEK
jgi:hypothetical protein